LFPPVVAAGSLMGLVSGEAATFGLPVGIPVTIAGHDHLAAAAGLGARPDDLLNSVGTAETLLRRLDTVPDVERAIGFDLAVTVWPGGEGWGVLAGCVRSGLVVQALTEHLGLEPGALDRLAGAVVENPGGHAGAGLPAGSEAKAAARVALPQEIEMEAGTPAEMWTATLRELARRTAAAADRVARLTGPSGRLVVYGGGSRSPTWLRIKAAELRVPVVGSPVADAAARGAALAAGVAAGWWSDVLAGPPPPLEGED
jgi:xylulokinase